MDPLPSLRGLHAFDAAARTGSFAAAAVELGVTPAAVSQLVRMIEEQFGRKLFHRQNRRIILTEAGRDVLPRLTAAFDELKQISRQLRGEQSRPSLTVSVPPSMVNGWLPTEIADFIAMHGVVDISMRGEDDPAPLEAGRIDLRLSYGVFHYPMHVLREIATDAVYPVCSPRFLEANGPFVDAEDLLAASLIHTDWGPLAANYPSWPAWFAANGLGTSRTIERGLVVNGSRAALDLAEAGLGIALGQGIYAAPLVAAGRLAVAVHRPVTLGQPYCLTIREASLRKPIVTQFADWLVERCIRCIESPQFRAPD